MKKYIKYLAIGCIVPLLATQSCKKDINEINKTNPNEFSDSDPKLIITGAQLANVFLNEGEAARLACIFAGQFTGYDRQYISYGQYNMTAGDFDSPWATLYSEGLAQSRLTREKAEVQKDSALVGVAQITEAHLLLTASSLWGDIPNTEACGASESPKFDKMADIYNYAINLLNSAIVNIGTSSKYKAAYAGDFSWVEVANSLKARAYLHLAKNTPANYDNAITAANSGIKLGKDFYAKHETESPGAWNIYYDFLDWNRGGYMSCDGSHMFALLDSASTKTKRNAKTDEKARFNYYFTLDNYTAVDPNMIDGIFKTTSNFALATYNETELILAECYARKNDLPNALLHLNNVRASHETEFGGYQAYVSGDFASGELLLKEILTEKYVTLFGQIEAFNDVRRTGNLISVPVNNGTKLPGRFLYPQTEINSNPNTISGLTLFDAVPLFK